MKWEVGTCQLECVWVICTWEFTLSAPFWSFNGSQQTSSPQPGHRIKASCKCLLMSLARVVQTLLSARRTPQALFSVVYIMKTVDFLNGFPGGMYRIIWNMILKNYTTTHLFPVPLETETQAHSPGCPPLSWESQFQVIAEGRDHVVFAHHFVLGVQNCAWHMVHVE